MTQNERHTGSKRRKDAKASPEESTEAESVAEQVRRYLAGAEHAGRARSYQRLLDAAPASFAAVFAMRGEGVGAHADALNLAIDLARRVGESAAGKALAVLRDEHQPESVRLLALEVLDRRGVLPPWRDLETLARGLSMRRAPGLAAACLRGCASQEMSEEERRRFHTYLVAPEARHVESEAAVIEAIALVEGLLAEHVIWEHREVMFEACFDLLQHPAPGVRLRALEAICRHCPLHWFERLRFVPQRTIDGTFTERLHGLVNRLWSHPLDLLTLSPTGFEHLVREWLRVKSYTSVKRRGVVHDDGVDLDATSADGTLCVVQCKRWKRGGTIGRSLLVDLTDAVLDSHARRGIFVTTTTFAGLARRFCEQTNAHNSRVSLELVDGPALVKDLEAAWGLGSVMIGAGAGAGAAGRPAQLELGARPPRTR